MEKITDWNFPEKGKEISCCKCVQVFFVTVVTNESLSELNEKFLLATTKTFGLSSRLKFQVLNCIVAKPFTFLVYKRLEMLPLRQGRSNFQEC